MKKRDAKLEGLRPNDDMPVRAMPASLPEDEKALEHHLGGFSTKKDRVACHEKPVSSPPPAPRRVFFRLLSDSNYGAVFPLPVLRGSATELPTGGGIIALDGAALVVLAPGFGSHLMDR